MPEHLNMGGDEFLNLSFRQLSCHYRLIHPATADRGGGAEGIFAL